MKKFIFSFVIATSLSAYVSADSCTKQVDGYTSALRVMQDSQNLSPAIRSQAESEYQRIQNLRENTPDCDVVDQVEALRKTKEALRAGNAAVRDSNAVEN